MPRSVVVLLLLALLAAPAAARTFEVLKPGNWAYDTLARIADERTRAGDPGPGGLDRPITRYAAAKLFAALVDRGVPADPRDLARLQAEFAPELALLGVRVAALEGDARDLAAERADMERKIERSRNRRIRASVETRLRFESNAWDVAPGVASPNFNDTTLRNRVNLEFGGSGGVSGVGSFDVRLPPDGRH